MRLATIDAEFWRPLTSRSRSSSAEGGRMKMRDEVVLHRLGKLLGALPVDIEENVAALGQRQFDRALGRAVEIAEHFRPFEQFAGIAHGGEALLRNEKIVLAVDLALRAADGW